MKPRDARHARLNVGDPLRALAALAVFGVHAVGAAVTESGYVSRLTPEDNNFAALYGVAGHAFNSLGSGVSVFFVLSAYLLSRPFLRTYIDDEPFPAVGRYLRNRALRILPAFWVVLAVALVLHGARGGSFAETAGFFGFVSGFKESALSDVLGQNWSLNVEARFYLFLPVAGAVLYAVRAVPGRHPGRTLRIAAVLALIAAGWHASVEYAPQDGPFFDSFAANASHFAPGLVLAVLEHVLPRRVDGARWVRVAAMPLFLTGVVLTLASQYLFFEGPASLSRWILPVGTGLILGGPLLWQWSGGRAWRILDNRVLRWLGARSYSLFLVHLLVIAGLEHHLATAGYNSSLLIIGSVTLAVSLLASEVLHRCVERPALRLRAGRPTGHRAAPSEPSSATPTAPAC